MTTQERTQEKAGGKNRKRRELTLTLTLTLKVSFAFSSGQPSFTSAVLQGISSDELGCGLRVSDDPTHNAGTTRRQSQKATKPVLASRFAYEQGGKPLLKAARRCCKG